MWSELRPAATEQFRRPAKGSDDDLDKLLAACALKQPVKKAMMARSVVVKEEEVAEEEELTSDEREAFLSLEKLRQSLADEALTEAVTRSLATTDWLRYYEERAELAAYTLSQELERNDFSVDGSTLDLQAKLEKLTGPAAFLLRLANQSLFADFLTAYRKELVSDVVADVTNGLAAGRYALRTGNDPSLEASLALDVCVPTDSGKLVLGTFTATVHVRWHQGAWQVERRVKRPELAAIFDDETKRAARYHVRTSGLPPNSSSRPLIGPLRVFGAARRGVGALGDLVKNATLAADDDEGDHNNTAKQDSDPKDLSRLLASRFRTSSA